MSHALSKIAPAAAALLLAASAGCRGGVDRRHLDAELMYGRAASQLELGQAEGCLATLDSIDSLYRDYNDIRRQAIDLRPRAQELMAMRGIAVADSTIAADKAWLDSVGPMLTHVLVPSTEGYYVATTGYDPQFMATTGLSGRVNERGEFYLVSSLNPASGTNHWSVSVLSGGEEATTDTVPYDGACNFRINGSEVVTFSPSQSERVGSFIESHRGAPMSVRFNGQSGRNVATALNDSRADAIATAFAYARAVNSMRQATIDREHCQALLEAARRQLANTPQ